MGFSLQTAPGWSGIPRVSALLRAYAAKIAAPFSLWMNTMNRCCKPTTRTPAHTVRHIAAAAACAVVSIFSAAPAAIAQTATMEHAVARNFPPHSQRGELRVTSSVEGVVDGKQYRLAPGLRIFNQQNQLLFAHSLVGQDLDVRYLIEPSTGMLLTAWILTKPEIEKEPPRRGWFRF